MPYPNEHAARIRDPGQYDRLRRENDAFGTGIHVIWGIKDEQAEVQSIRFDKDRFTVAEAKQWLADHDYEYLEFEPAGESSAMTYHERKTIQCEVKNLNDETGQLTLVFSTFNIRDHDGDVTLPGAFKNGAPTRMSHWGHRWDKPVIGKGVIQSDETKAWLDGHFFLDMESAKETYFSVKGSGELQEWSYGYDILDGGAEQGEFEGEPVRFLQPRTDGMHGIEVHEISPVLKGSGIGTRTTGIKHHSLRMEDHFQRVLLECEAFQNRVKSLTELREEQNRDSLNEVNRQRLMELQKQLYSLEEQIVTLLREQDTDSPQAEQLFMEYQQIQARMNGVYV